jgi:DNA-binding transcriptional MerR regulator
MSDEKKHPQSWTLDELAAKANEALSAGEPADARDSRLSGTLTSRNIRRLQSAGAINPPRKSGREAYYNDEHLGQLLEARSLMSKGVAASAIPALREASNGTYLASSEPKAPAPPCAAMAAPSTARALAFLGASTAEPTLAQAPGSLELFKNAAFSGASPAPRSMESLWAPVAKAPVARAVFECEPLPGLRVSASPAPGSEPLDQASLDRVLQAVQAAWNAARAPKN